MKESKGRFEIKTDKENGKILEIKIVFDGVEDNLPNPVVFNNKRDKTIYEMRVVEGKTLQEIGNQFNLSRQRIEQILKRINAKHEATNLLGLANNSDLKISLGAARVNAGIPVHVAADKLGISSKTLHNYESYKTRPKLNTLIEMSVLYEWPVESLELFSKEERKE